MKNPAENILRKGSEMNRALRNEANKLRSKWRKVVTGNECKRVRDHIRETEEQPRFIKLFDKVSFTLGVLNICACQFFLLIDRNGMQSSFQHCSFQDFVISAAWVGNIL